MPAHRPPDPSKTDTMEIELPGCRPDNLGAYLKGLGVFRILAEQKDPDVRAWWKNGNMVVQTTLDHDGLVEFLLTYRPTPIVAPWNGGSGFYGNDDTSGLDAIRNSPDLRFQIWHEALRIVKTWTEITRADLTLAGLRRLAEVARDSATGKPRQAMENAIGAFDTNIAFLAAEFEVPDPQGMTVAEVSGKWENHRVRLHDGGPEVATRQRGDKAVREITKFRNLVAKKLRDRHKVTLALRSRNRLPDDAARAAAALMPILGDGAPAYPPIFGSGGNEGRLDYSNNFARRLADLFTLGEAKGPLLRNALFNDFTCGYVNAPVGQHDPGAAGGANQGQGVEIEKPPVNPWNYILCLEGALAWVSGIARRNGTEASAVLASPFTVETRGVGYSSASNTDPKSGRAEVWVPEWTKPCTFREVRELLREGRAEIAGRTATTAVELAAATSGLGVVRGIDRFHRFLFLKRRGKSFAAVPGGTVAVSFRPENDLATEMLGWVRSLRAWEQRMGNEAPATLSSRLVDLEGCLYRMCVAGGTAACMQVLLTIGKLEMFLATSDIGRKKKMPRPVSGLSPRWIEAADDSSPELRLAAALASIGPTGRVGPLRANLAPVDPTFPDRWARNAAQKTWVGVNQFQRLSGVLRRRMMDAGRLGAENNPVWARLRLHPSDACRMLDPGLDASKLELLLFACCCLDWGKAAATGAVAQAWKTPLAEIPVPRPYALLKLLFLPGPLPSAGEEQGMSVPIRPEPTIPRLLDAGRVSEACELARRRLFASGFAASSSPAAAAMDGQRLSALLLVPVRKTEHLLRLVSI